MLALRVENVEDLDLEPLDAERSGSGIRPNSKDLLKRTVQESRSSRVLKSLRADSEHLQAGNS